MKTNHPRTIIFWILAAGVFLFLLMYGRTRYSEDQARFNVDVLERFIQIYYEELGRYPNYLWELSPTQVASYKEGLELDLKNVLTGRWRGYRYDYVVIDGKQFVLSASPIGFLSGRQEFAVAEDGILRRNDYDIDAAADTHDEVTQWEAIDRCPSIVSRVSPGE